MEPVLVMVTQSHPTKPRLFVDIYFEDYCMLLRDISSIAQRGFIKQLT